MSRSILASLAALALGAASATAQTWPDRPIKLVVPTGPGAATDVMARLLADDVGRRLGQSMIVENRAGASGFPAHQSVATAEPDGYTLLFSATSGMASNIVSFKKLPYDPTSDFVPVAMVVSLGPQLVSVNQAVPTKNLGELIAYARANAGKVSYAADATAGAAVFVGRLINKRGEMGMAEVPYRSAAQMSQDAATGVVPVLISSIAVANPFMQSGRLRPIAIMSSQRFPTLPDVQTVAETLTGVQLDGWFVVVAPKGTPVAIIRRVNAAIGEFLKGDDIQKRLHAIGLATSGADTPEGTAAFIRREQDRWRALAKELDIQPQ